MTGKLLAGVVGNPIAHSLSPLIHNAWIAAGGLDATYEKHLAPLGGFAEYIATLRGRGVRGVNVTLPFKQDALAIADRVNDRARMAEAANLLVFDADGAIIADNTDGLGMLGALVAQAPGFDPQAGPAIVLGAGGAARGAAAALVAAGCPRTLIINRTQARAQAIADALGGRVEAVAPIDVSAAFESASVVINATSAGLAGEGQLDVPLEATPTGCVVMDMVYKPLLTPFLAQAKALGRPTVDGLEMLIRQAVPSFEAFFGQTPDPTVDVRALALAALEAKA